MQNTYLYHAHPLHPATSWEEQTCVKHSSLGGWDIEVEYLYPNKYVEEEGGP